MNVRPCLLTDLIDSNAGTTVASTTGTPAIDLSGFSDDIVAAIKWILGILSGSGR